MVPLGKAEWPSGVAGEFEKEEDDDSISLTGLSGAMCFREMDRILSIVLDSWTGSSCLAREIFFVGDPRHICGTVEHQSQW